MRYRKTDLPSRIVCLRGERHFNAAIFQQIDNSMCPFMGRLCRKSTGVCELAFEKQDMIVCPFRFEEDGVIFSDAAEIIGVPISSLVIKSEIKICDSFFDFVLHDLKVPGGGYSFMEVQALDISGSSWWEIEKLKKAYGIYGRTSEPHKPVGPNWQMSVKTLFVEILKKGRIANLIDAPLFIVLQDGLWGYIAKKYRIIESDTGLLWMIYTIDDLGKLRLSRCVHMEYDSFLKMINSESLDSPEVILGKLNDAFLKNERTK